MCPISGDIPFDDQKDVKSKKDFNEVFNSMLPQISPPYLGLPGLCFSNKILKKQIPLGIQFITKKFREDHLIRVGYDLEKLYPKIIPVTPNF